MFLCAGAGPRFNDDGEFIFDGKIGLWPFVETTVALCDSCNRPAGTLELKNSNVTKEVYLDFMVNKVVPAIKNKFRQFASHTKNIRVQHDNAKAHFKNDETEGWHEASKAGNWNINLTP